MVYGYQFDKKPLPCWLPKQYCEKGILVTVQISLTKTIPSRSMPQKFICYNCEAITVKQQGAQAAL